MLLAGPVGTGAGLPVALQVQGALHVRAAVLALRIRGTTPVGGDDAAGPAPRERT
jgi:hypothetical protein